MLLQAPHLSTQVLKKKGCPPFRVASLLVLLGPLPLLAVCP